MNVQEKYLELMRKAKAMGNLEAVNRISNTLSLLSPIALKMEIDDKFNVEYRALEKEFI